MKRDSGPPFEIKRKSINIKEDISKELSNFAEAAKEQIKINSNLSESINLIKDQIKTIKQIYESIANNNSKNRLIFVYQIISTYKENLLKLNKNLIEDIKKYSLKENNTSKKLNTENYQNLQRLDLLTVDDFLLQNKNTELQYTIKRLKFNIKSSKEHNVYREPQRDVFTESHDAEDIIYDANLKEQQRLLKNGRQYNKYHNNIFDSLRKIKKYKNQINFYNNIIYVILKKSNEIFNTHYQTEQFNKNNNNKKDNINEIINSINKTLNDSQKKNIIHQKIDLLKLDELFDISNIEGKNEAIIDDELHSDDEVVFEDKIHPIKKIMKNYFASIKLKVPKIDLSQIEFNKIKIMNEDDLYSEQKRKFNQKNINTNLIEIKKAIKKIQRRCNLNKKKLDAIQNFIEDVKYNYKILRPLKIKSTVSGNHIDDYYKNKYFDIVGEAIDQNENQEKNEKIKESQIDEEVGSDYSDEDKYEQDSKDSNEKKEYKNCVTDNNYKNKTILITSDNRLNKNFKNQIKKKVEKSTTLRYTTNNRANSK